MNDIYQCEYCDKFFSRNFTLKRHISNGCKAKELREEIEETNKKFQKERDKIRKLEQSAKKNLEEKIAKENDENANLPKLASKMAEMVANIIKDDETKEKAKDIITKTFDREKAIKKYCNDKKTYLKPMDMNDVLITEYIDRTPNKITVLVDELYNLNADGIEDEDEYLRNHQIFERLATIASELIKKEDKRQQMVWGITNENTKPKIMAKMKLNSVIGWYINKRLETFNQIFLAMIQRIYDMMREYKELNKASRTSRYIALCDKIQAITEKSSNSEGIEDNQLFRDLFVNCLAKKLNLKYSDILYIVNTAPTTQIIVMGNTIQVGEINQAGDKNQAGDNNKIVGKQQDKNKERKPKKVIREQED